MPHRKRPASTPIYKDVLDIPGILTNANKPKCFDPPVVTEPPPPKRQRRSILREKHNLNVVDGRSRVKASTAKREIAAIPMEEAKNESKEEDNIDVKPVGSQVEGLGGARVEEVDTKKEEKLVSVKVPEPGESNSVVENSVPRKLALTLPKPHPASLEARPITLTDQVISFLTSTQPSLSLNIPRNSNADTLASFITTHRLWSPALLTLFQPHPLTTLNLTTQASNADPSPLLRVFFTQHTFTKLTTLSLSTVSLDVDSIAHLRLLSSLSSLDISSTGIDNRAISNLVCHRRTLSTLNLSNNPSVTDDARVPLVALSALAHLHLRGTSFTMPGLRRLVTDLESRYPLPISSLDAPTQQRKMVRLVTIPTACLDALNNPTSYAPIIPKEQGYVENARIVDALDIKMLKKNLELHQRVNKGLSLAGGKIELIYRLREVLEKRAGDARLRRALLGEGVCVGSAWV